MLGWTVTAGPAGDAPHAAGLLAPWLAPAQEVVADAAYNSDALRAVIAEADYIHFMQQLAAAYPKAEKIVLVQDNLNIHTDAAFYQHLLAAQARALTARFEMHYTSKNASWLNTVELELSAIARQFCTIASPPRTNSPPTSPLA